MREAKLICVALGALLVSAVFASAMMDVTARPLSDAELAKIETGEIILESNTVRDAKGNARATGLAIGFIDAPKDKIMDTILDYPSYPEFMPRVKAISLTGEGEHQVVNYTIKVTLLTIKYAMVHQVDRAAGTIQFNLDKTKKNDIADSQGFWALKPHKNGTIIYYSVLVDTGMAVPKAIEDYLTKKDLPNLIAKVRERTLK